MSIRHGKTLIEMTVIISCLSILLPLVATTMALVMKVERQVRGDLAQQTTLARLGSRFRTDVHTAQSATAGDASIELVLSAERTIRYAAVEKGIRREVVHGGQVEHRDAFRLPAGASAVFDVSDAGRGQLARLTISRKPVAPKRFDPAVRPAVIDAAINLHERSEAMP